MSRICLSMLSRGTSKCLWNSEGSLKGPRDISSSSLWAMGNAGDGNLSLQDPQDEWPQCGSPGEYQLG